MFLWPKEICVEGSHSGSKNGLQEEEPSFLAQLEWNRQYGRSTRTVPLTIAIKGWEKKENSDIGNKKQILWID